MPIPRWAGGEGSPVSQTSEDRRGDLPRPAINAFSRNAWRANSTNSQNDDRNAASCWCSTARSLAGGCCTARCANPDRHPFLKPIHLKHGNQSLLPSESLPSRCEVGSHIAECRFCRRWWWATPRLWMFSSSKVAVEGAACWNGCSRTTFTDLLAALSGDRKGTSVGRAFRSVTKPASEIRLLTAWPSSSTG